MENTKRKGPRVIGTIIVILIILFLSIEFRDRMVKLTSGCCARYGVVIIATIGSAVGIAAMRTWPARPCFSALIS